MTKYLELELTECNKQELCLCYFFIGMKFIFGKPVGFSLLWLCYILQRKSADLSLSWGY